MQKDKQIDLSYVNFHIPIPKYVKFSDKSSILSQPSNKTQSNVNFGLSLIEHNDPSVFQQSKHNHRDTAKNPFKRTQYLFKISPENNKKKVNFSEQQNINKKRIQNIYNAEQMTLFESFGLEEPFFINKHHQGIVESISSNTNIFLQQNHEFQVYETHRSNKIQQIRIQDYSIIDDDYLKPPTQCKEIDSERFSKVTQMNLNEGVFFLTQNESKESIKQFCYNLEEIQHQNQFKNYGKKNEKKTQVKKIIYNFLDELDLISDKKINEQFIKQLRKTFLMLENNKEQERSNLKEISNLRERKLERKSSKSPLSTNSKSNKHQNQIKKEVWKCPGKVLDMNHKATCLNSKTARKLNS